ncbi:hypothetical protein [Dactylosporangium sp. CA-092794]
MKLLDASCKDDHNTLSGIHRGSLSSATLPDDRGGADATRL